ncbi:hypothetical protein BH09MYX1_BH09MYX1_36440 [soil metagenome]
MKAVFAAALLLSCSCASEYVVWRGHAPDRATDIRVVERGGSQRLIVGGVAQTPHRAVGIDAIAMNGGHVAYAVTDGAGWSVTRDGAASTSSWDAIGDVVLDQAGTHLAYVAARGGSFCVVLDEMPGARFEAIDRGTLAIDRTGQPVYVGWRKEKAYVVEGGSLGPAWDTVHDLRVEGAVVYVGRDGNEERVVSGSAISPPYEAIDELEGDGYLARRGEDTIAVVHGRKVATGSLHGLAVGGSSWAVAMKQGDDEVVFRDGAVVSERFTTISAIALSPAGDRAAWVGERAGRATVVVDGVGRGTWAWARALRLTANDGFAFVGSMGAGAVVVTHRGRAAFDVVVEDSLVVSADGNHWACVVGYQSTRTTYVAVDGKPRIRFDLGEWTDTAALNVGRGTARRIAQLQAWVRTELDRALSHAPS